MTPFDVGAIYHRGKEIHAIYSGQSQGGISTPAGHPYVFLFTGTSGEAYGYEDQWRSDGTFWYTGEGQSGNMEMVRGNRSIAQHDEQNKQLLLFEYVEPSQVRFVGEFKYIDHHIEQRPDKKYFLSWE